jgi:hypothetical protein
MDAIQKMLVDHLLHDPFIQGALIKVITDASHAWFKNVDDSGALKKEPWLQPTAIIASLIATALSLAASGNLQNLDLSTLGSLVTAFIGAKVVGTQTVQAVTQQVKASVTK